MNSTPSPTQSEFSAGRLPTKSSVDATTLVPSDLRNDAFLSKPPSLGRRGPRALARFLITFCIGVAATLAWQSYGDAGRKMIASASPRLGWLAPPQQPAPVAQTAPDTIAPTAPSPDQQQLTAMSLNLAAVRQSVDQLAAVRQSVDQIAAGQEQITRDITKLQAAEQSILARSQRLRRARLLQPARKPAPRLSQARLFR
jgi:hypothetical protein